MNEPDPAMASHQAGAGSQPGGLVSFQLVQLFIPRADALQRPYPSEVWAKLRRELVERFGGVTIYARAPASGLWANPDGEVEADELVIVEVQDRDLDRRWWTEYREQLEARFGQQEILVRAFGIQIL